MVAREWIESLSGTVHILVNTDSRRVLATLKRTEQLEVSASGEGWVWEWVERKSSYVGLAAAKKAAERHA